MRRWKNSLVIALLMVAFGNCPRVSGQTPNPVEVPKIILSGLEAYKTEGPEAAVKAWLKGGPLEGSKEALSQANVLRQIQDFYGAYKTFDIVQSKNLAPSVRVVYLTLDFEKGPLYAKFVAYRTDKDWILTSFDLNTKAEVILPACP